MMVSGSTKKLFICMKVTNELERMFEEKRTLYATYIQGGDPERLKVVTIDGSKFLGKIVDQGLRVAEVPDIGRHIRSVVAKFCPDMRTSDEMMKIFVQEYIG
jgi:hypothetical protein